MKEKKYKNKEWLEQKYEELNNNVAIGKVVGVSGDTIEYWRKKHGIEKPKLIPPNKKHIFNEDFFEVIDTEEKAYWLGFLMADGAITSSSKKGSPDRINICLKEEDKEHLELFKKSINNNDINIKTKEIYSRGHISYTCELRINSVKMVSDLKKHGITKNKTGKEQIPNTVPDYLIRHFLRGMFDGDGCICVSYKKYLRYSICGASKTFHEQHIKYIKENLDIDLYLNERKQYNTDFYLTGTNAYESSEKILNHYYKDATIYLKRKHDKFVDYCSANGKPLV